jgi:hypothetical protein
LLQQTPFPLLRLVELLDIISEQIFYVTNVVCSVSKKEKKGLSFVLVEVEYGYRNVSHVADSVVVNVCVRIPIQRIRSSVEEHYHVGNVSHIGLSVLLFGEF